MENAFNEYHGVKRVKKSGIKPVTFIALTFIILIIIGTVLLSLPFTHNSGEFFPIPKAFFTATSAVCVTGLVVADTLTEFNFGGQVVLILLIQLGGLGLMTMATLIFILAGKRITLKERLILQEAYSQTDLQGLVKLTLKIAKYTFIIEGVGALLLFFSFLPEYGFLQAVWKGIFHAVSAFCNAGFDLIGKGNSLVSMYNRPFTLIPIMLLIALGGLGFCVIIDVINHRTEKKKLSLHSKAVLSLTAAFILVGAIVFFIAEYNNPKTMGEMNFFEKILSSFFQSITTRTAGFNSIDQAGMTNTSVVASDMLMFIGASSGGTGGGIKTTTFLIIIMMFLAGAQGKDEIVAFKHTIKIKMALKAFSIAAMALMVIFAHSIIVFSIENAVGNPLVYKAVLFESFSAFGTVGLSMGITSSFSTPSLIVTAVVMYIGRLGALFLGLIFLGKKSKTLHYSEYKIIIG